MKKVRVLHISKYYYPFTGGTEQVARQCVRALKEACDVVYEQAVFCFDHKGMKGPSAGERSVDSVDRVDGIRVVRCRCEAKVASQSLSFSYRRRLKAVFVQFDPDIVILHYPNPFAAHYLLSFLKPDQKLVIYWHLDIVKQKLLGKLFAGQNRRLLERADRVVATSPNYIEGSAWLSQYRRKCVAVPNCIDESGLDGNYKEYQKDKILCLAVGRHVEYKGFRYLIEAAQYLDDRFEIVITGGGPLTVELKEQAEELKRYTEEEQAQEWKRQAETEELKRHAEAEERKRYAETEELKRHAEAEEWKRQAETEELKRHAEAEELKRHAEAEERKRYAEAGEAYQPENADTAEYAQDNLDTGVDLNSRGKGFPEIIFAGLVSDEELKTYLHACDIFCFPSITKNEAFGIALAEAMYCSKPAVTFTIEGSGVNYVSLDGVTGIECPNRDSRAFAEAMKLLAERPDLRERYGKAARKRVEELFLYKQYAAHVRSLMAELA